VGIRSPCPLQRYHRRSHMKKLSILSLVFGLLVLALFFVFCAKVSAQTPTRQSALPRCNVGADPVNASRQPTANEEVVANPADQKLTYKSGNGRYVTCILQAGVPVVVDKTTGIAGWVYGCGNPISTPWAPKRMPPTPIADTLRGLPGIPGLPGKDGYTPIKGVDYFDGRDGYDGRNGKNGFCSSKKCKIVLVAIGGAAAGYAAYYYWPCPPGTVRRY